MKCIILSVLFFIASQLEAQEIGLQLYSLRNQFKTDVPGTLALIKKWNIHEIEGGGTYGLPMNDYKKLLAENNLKMIGVSADFDSLAKNPQPIINEAKAFGAKYIVCFWIPHNDSFTIDNIKQATDVFNTVGKIIHDNGLSFCYHPHGYEFTAYKQGTLFDYMILHTNPKYVNYEMDVFWIKQPAKTQLPYLKSTQHGFYYYT